jgi:hypothetical protein
MFAMVIKEYPRMEAIAHRTKQIAMKVSHISPAKKAIHAAISKSCPRRSQKALIKAMMFWWNDIVGER